MRRGRLAKAACRSCKKLRIKCVASSIDGTCQGCQDRRRTCVWQASESPEADRPSPPKTYPFAPQLSIYPTTPQPSTSRASPKSESPPQALSWHSPDAVTCRSTSSASLRLVLLQHCISTAVQMPGRILCFTGALDVVKNLRAANGVLEDMPQNLAGVAQQLMVIGARAGKQVTGEALDAACGDLESSIRKQWASRQLAPSGTLPCVVSELLYLQNVVWTDPGRHAAALQQCCDVGLAYARKIDLAKTHTMQSPPDFKIWPLTWIVRRCCPCS